MHAEVNKRFYITTTIKLFFSTLNWEVNKCRIALDAVLIANVPVLSTVHFAYIDFIYPFFGKFGPSRCKMLTMSTPRCKKLYKPPIFVWVGSDGFIKVFIV